MSWGRTWRQLDPRQESADGDALLLRLALLGSVPVAIAYGSAGLIYGHLAMLTPFGFIAMPGACAWLAAIAGFALAVVAIDLLVGGFRVKPATLPVRHIVGTRTVWRSGEHPVQAIRFRTALPPAPAVSRFPTGRWGLRGAGLLVAAIAGASALVGRGLMALGLDVFTRPVIAFAPQAEWPLWPLTTVWPVLLPLARDDLVLGLIVTGVLLFFASQFLASRKVRGAWLPLAFTLPLMVAAAYLGSAGYDFAAARGLGGLQDADLVRGLARDPGRHNFYAFLSLWVAIGCTFVGLPLCYLLCRAQAKYEDAELAPSARRRSP